MEGKIVREIVLHPLSLSILGGSILAAWLMDFWYIVLLGLAAEVFLFSWLSRDEKFRTRVQAEMSVAALSELNEKCDAGVGSYWQRSWGMRQGVSPLADLYLSKQAVWQSFKKAPPDIQLMMKDLVELSLKSAAGFVELYRTKKTLSEAANEAQRTGALKELERLRVKARASQTEEARQEYEKAISYKEEEIASYESTIARIATLDARMDKINAALSGIHGKMAAVSTFDARDYDQEVLLLRTEAQALAGAVSEIQGDSSRR